MTKIKTILIAFFLIAAAALPCLANILDDRIEIQTIDSEISYYKSYDIDTDTKAAIRAIEKITGEEFGRDPEKWQNWLEERYYSTDSYRLSTVTKIAIIYIVTFIIAAIIEFLIAYIFLIKNVTKVQHLFQTVFLVNLITFPLTQILAYCLVCTYFTINKIYYAAEIIPFIAEYFLLKWRFGRLYKKDCLKEPVTDKVTILIVIVANLATFILGIIVFE